MDTFTVGHRRGTQGYVIWGQTTLCVCFIVFMVLIVYNPLPQLLWLTASSASLVTH